MTKRIFLFLFILLVSTQHTFSQLTIGNDMSKIYSIIDLPTPKAFISLDGRYSINLPEHIPFYQTSYADKDDFGRFTGNFYECNFKEGEVSVGFFDYLDNSISGSEQDLRTIAQKISHNLVSTSQEILEESFFNLGNFPAWKFQFTTSEGKIGLRRLYLVKNRLYMIATDEQEISNKRFLDATFETFKVLSPKEVETRIQSKIDLIIGDLLPQKPVLKKQLSDASEENLKGKVKTIIEDNEYVFDTSKKYPRRPSEIREYNKIGNLEKILRFDNQGNPNFIEIFGFIDGRRVSKTRRINHFYDPPRPRAITSKTQPELKIDERYSTRQEKKYDKGKLIENILYNNAGKMLSRYVYTYKDNIIEKLIYYSDEPASNKHTYISDNKGFVSEEIIFDFSAKKIRGGDRKYKYSYVFDNKGNWIKRFTTWEVIENGNTIFKPINIDYRIITYY